MNTNKKLEIVPISLKEANFFIQQNHRHHSPVVGHKFSIAVADVDGVIRGVATTGRPVSRHLDNGWILEVNRVATDGTPNACSMLYAASWRVAKALGYKKLITYTLNTETGISLRASGWRCLGECGGGSWNCKSRPRIDTNPTQTKIRWETGEL